MDIDTRKLRGDLEDFRRRYAGSRIGVLYGPLSFEDREYIQSVPEEQASGAAIVTALAELGFVPILIDPTKDDILLKAKECSFVFNNLHGEFGEDGAVQALFKYHEIKLTGACILAHAVGINKEICKLVVRGMNINTPKYITVSNKLNEEHLSELLLRMISKYPCIIKPMNGGTSVGVKLCTREDQIFECVTDMFKYESSAIVEEYIEGYDVTVGIIEVGGQLFALPPLRIYAESGIYGEEEKLKGHWIGGVEYECPANIGEDLISDLKNLSLNIYVTLQCSGFVRIDWRVSVDDKLHFLELNTNPGISIKSNFALGAYAIGLSYKEIILCILLSVDKQAG